MPRPGSVRAAGASAQPNDLPRTTRRSRVNTELARRQAGPHQRVAALSFALCALCGLCCGLSFSAGAGEPSREALQTASRMVRASGASGGICAVIGSPDTDLALALAKQGGFVVHCLCPEPRLLDGMRKAVHARGLYGTVSVGMLSGGRLPYAENMVNLLVVAGEGPLPMEEVMRVLVPRGVAYVRTDAGWTEAVKPWPEDIDEWTHYLHGADGNPVARDLVVGPPRRFQWISGPFWMRSHETDSSVCTLVTARGRLFLIVDEAPISLAGQHPLPDKWFLIARDAFNGVLLWKVPIRRWGWREWKNTWFKPRPGDMPLNIQKRLVASGDEVYVTLGYQAPVSRLDARTGEITKTYAGTERTGEILYLDGTLVLSVLTGDGVRVMSVDAETGERRWVTEKAYQGSLTDYCRWSAMHGRVKAPKFDPSLNTATDGAVVAFIDGPDIVCLDYETGAERWRTDFPEADADRHAGRIAAGGNLWIGTMIVSNDAVVHASPGKLAAFDAETGEVLWSRPKRYIGHLWYEWKDVFVIDGLVWTWGEDLGVGEYESRRGKKQRTLHPRSVNGYDVRTGELKKKVPLGGIFKAHHHHRCYRNKATVRYVLASRRGTEYIDLREGRHAIHNWVRGACHVGMMPANGLQYAPPHPCICYIDEKLNGMLALAPAGDDAGGGAGDDGEPRLVRGPAFGRAGGTAPAASDWPAFRHDSMRTGSVETEVPGDACRLWRVDVGRKGTPPTVVGDRVFLSLVDEHHVVCLDTRDGTEAWAFAAGGRVDSPPTYHRGSVLFGSADGSVYCLRAGDGAQVWRFRAAPEARLTAAFGQLESAWPVHGSVLVVNDTVYFAAGRSSMLDDGIYLYGLDAATGELRASARLEGPHYTVENIERNFRLPMGALPDILMSDGSRIYMRSATFDLNLERAKGRPELRTRSGFLDDSYFKRTPWRFVRGGLSGQWGRLIVHDKRSVYYVRMFDSLRGLDPTVYFTPGQKGYLLFAKNMHGKPAAKGKQNTWMERVPVRIRAMVLAGKHLLVAGPPDVVDPGDPLGAFEGRKGGLLYVVDAASGGKLAEHELPSPPVFNGLVAAAGRFYVAEEDGSITCFGEPAVAPGTVKDAGNDDG